MVQSPLPESRMDGRKHEMNQAKINRSKNVPTNKWSGVPFTPIHTPIMLDRRENKSHSVLWDSIEIGGRQS